MSTFAIQLGDDMPDPDVQQRYRALTDLELAALWDDGNYAGPIEDYKAIEAVLHSRIMAGVPLPPKACAMCLSVVCVCGKKNGERV